MNTPVCMLIKSYVNGLLCFKKNICTKFKKFLQSVYMNLLINVNSMPAFLSFRLFFLDGQDWEK